MKRTITAIFTAIFLLTIALHALAAPPDPASYMGFSVSDDWYIFSKNMGDEALLDAVDLTVDEVNEALMQSDCEYFLTNPKEQAEIYVKIRENAIAEEFYNIFEAEDDFLRQALDRILTECFSVDAFSYRPEDVVITPYSQMKFVTVPGTVQYDGKREGLVFGFTFVNGKGIAFMMQVESAAPTAEDVDTVLDIASSVSFTVIQQPGEKKVAEPVEEARSPKPLGYIAGGFGALALAAICLYLVSRIRQSNPETEEEQSGETDENMD